MVVVIGNLGNIMLLGEFLGPRSGAGSNGRDLNLQPPKAMIILQMKMSCKLSPDDSNPQEVHGHLLIKKDRFLYSIPSEFNPFFRGFSTKKFFGPGIPSGGFRLRCRKKKKKAFSNG
jgi:hypothetical protein